MYSIVNEGPVLAPVRWFYVIPMGAVTTFGLLLLMFKLVYMEDMLVREDPIFEIADVFWEERPPIQTIRKTLEKPVDIQDMPPRPELKSPEVIDIVNALPTQKYEKPELKAVIAFNANTPIEHLIVSPRYPSRALVKGLEGFVELRFDVNKTGATANIEVMRSEPKGVFENAAIAAAERWKFQPKTVDGRPVYFRGLSKVVTFEMQDK